MAALLFIIAIVAIPFISSFINSKYLKGKKLNLRISLISAFLMYLLILTSAISYDYYLDYKLNQFDLDGDGIFSGIEVTQEQGIALNAVTNDLSRSLAPFTGAAFSAFYFISLFLGMWLIKALSNVYKTRDT